MSIYHLILLCGLAGSVLACESEASRQEPTVIPTSTEGMVWIDRPDGGFWMDETEVTTEAFGRFVQATGYRTEADSFGWSGVFSLQEEAWLPVEGANWQYPQGPDEAPAAPNQPVTQVSLKDAKAYAAWAGKRLPTEEEWMYAATQGQMDQKFPWGSEMLPNGAYLGNWWQGPFPYKDEVMDGYPGIAEVRQFPVSPNGLYDISGNVWEWTDSRRPATGEMIIKGGSFLCSTSYCTGFNLQQRQYTPPDSGLNHLGFRCIAG